MEEVTEVVMPAAEKMEGAAGAMGMAVVKVRETAAETAIEATAEIAEEVAATAKRTTAAAVRVMGGVEMAELVIKATRMPAAAARAVGAPRAMGAAEPASVVQHEAG